MTGRHARWVSGEITPLRVWCRDHGISYGELARRTALDRSTIIRSAVGRTNPTGAALVALHRETGLSLEALKGRKMDGRR